MNIWEILELCETKDLTSIKRAYAKKAAVCHPEEHEQEFLELRWAYESAIAFANQPESVGCHPESDVCRTNEETHRFHVVSDETKDTETAEQEQPAFTWSFDEEEKIGQFDHCDGIVKFRDLVAKKCSDKNIWIKYFVSPEFLEVSLEKGFCRLLAQEITAKTIHKSVTKPFLSVLRLFYSAYDQICGYDFSEEDHDQIMEQINSITATDLERVRLSPTEIALLEGYKNYFQMMEYKDLPQWNEDIYHMYSRILDRFASAYIYDNITDLVMRNSVEFLPRHITSLKLLDYFFSCAKLPKEAFVILWNKLDLKNATMGKNKILYGRLRELALENHPELEQKPKESYSQLRSDYAKFNVSMLNCDSDFEEKETADFLGREDLKRALTDYIFVNEEILRYWITVSANSCFLKRIAEYCQNHTEVAYRENIITACEGILRDRRIKQAYEQDNQASADEGNAAIHVYNQAFFRYYLHTAFLNGYSTKYESSLTGLLHDFFPPSLSWTKRFLESEKQFSVDFGGQHLTILLHSMYIEYRLDDKPVYHSLLSFDDLFTTEDDTLFWLLLPLTFAHISNMLTVEEEVFKRLDRLPFLNDCPKNIIASCVAETICRDFNQQETYQPSLLQMQKEYHGLLYTCSIYLYEEITMQVTRTEVNGDHTLLQQEICTDLTEAIEQGQQMLDQLSQPFDVNTLEIKMMPRHVTVEMDGELPRVMNEDSITITEIRNLLYLLSAEKVTRLEMHWTHYCLVILKSLGKYAFFCFDDTRKYRYAFLSSPEIYQNTSMDEIVHENFLYSTLPEYVLHDDPQFILTGFNMVVDQICFPYSHFEHDSNHWQIEVYFNKPHQYKLDKCLLAKFPIYTPREYLNKKFTISVFPSHLLWKEQDSEIHNTMISPPTRHVVSDELFDFLNKRLNRLILCWKERYLVLLAEPDQETYALLYLEDDTKDMQMLVRDHNSHCNASEDHISIGEICGLPVPEICIHNMVNKIHSYLFVLLPYIESLQAVFSIPSEFVSLAAYNHWNQPWDYEKIKQAILEEDQS